MQELKVKAQRNAAYWLSPSGLYLLACLSTFLTALRLSCLGGYFPWWDGTFQQLPIKKMPHRYVHGSTCGMQFLNWGSLVPSDSGLCQVDSQSSIWHHFHQSLQPPKNLFSLVDFLLSQLSHRQGNTEKLTVVSDQQGTTTCHDHWREAWTPCVVWSTIIKNVPSWFLPLKLKLPLPLVSCTYKSLTGFPVLWILLQT